MRATLLGSALDGPWPDPWCGCGTCRDARSRRLWRDRASLLVGDRTLLDLPATPWHDGLTQVSDIVRTGAPGPDDPVPPARVRVHRLRAGEQMVSQAGPVVALPAVVPDAVALLLPDQRLLYAPHGVGGQLPGPVDLAVLGGPVPGDVPPAGQVVVLARHGRAATATLVSGTGPLPDDGAVLRGRRTVLVTGGSRSGKSRHAERLLASVPSVTYLASGPVPGPGDVEWAARVRAHRERRPPSWATVESADVTATLRAADSPVLWDCVGTWLTAQLDAAGAWDQAAGWRAQVDGRIAALLAGWGAARTTVVAVTNEVGSALVPATASGRLFTDLLGSINTSLADAADEVVLVVAGRAVPL